ncbi:MAG TPA: prolipoprotein diacylglyceryl transferase [Terricaulis sp.]|nr:prolipoprotein diacylglyceryl transferase [Terricaulis sp.]
MALQFPEIDPVALSLGTLPIGDGLRLDLRWYALAYIAGLFLGWRWMVWLIRRDRLWAPGKPALSVPMADDFLFWATLGVILGGRLGYVLFYKPEIIWTNPAEVLQIWQGGMSFHGGLIGVAVAAFFFAFRIHQGIKPRTHVDEDQFAALAKKHATAERPSDGGPFVRFSGIGWLPRKEAEALRVKTKTQSVDLLRLGDLAAAAAPIGLFFGRIANFINGELWGRHTDAPWAITFPEGGYSQAAKAWIWLGHELPRHPSQLYEAALEGIALFVIINLATLKFDSLRRPGLNVGLFLVFYGLFRALMETVREPDAHMPEALRGVVTMGMLLSIPMILIGAWLIQRAFKQPKLAAA